MDLMRKNCLCGQQTICSVPCPFSIYSFRSGTRYPDEPFFLVAGVILGYIISFCFRGKNLPDDYYESRKAKARNTKEASGNYRIIYVDREGVETKRDISVQQIEKDENRLNPQGSLLFEKSNEDLP
jgi:hypothetical protein